MAWSGMVERDKAWWGQVRQGKMDDRRTRCPTLLQAGRGERDD